MERLVAAGAEILHFYKREDDKNHKETSQIKKRGCIIAIQSQVMFKWQTANILNKSE